MTIIYAYTKNNQAYIGKTKNPELRKLEHKKRFGEWEYKVLDEIPSFKKEDWKPYECAWIQIYKEWGYNIENKNNGGGGPQGFRTEKEKKQIKKQSTKQWNLDNKERVNQYNLINREKRAEKMRQWYLANREKELERGKQQRLANPEYLKQYYLNKTKPLKKNTL
jgi:hypothetical protein